MEFAFSSKNKLGFVDGTIPQPDASSSDFPLWKWNNRIIASWIINSVTPEIYASVIFSSSTATIWSDLKARFQQKNGPHIFQPCIAQLHSRFPLH